MWLVAFNQERTRVSFYWEILQHDGTVTQIPPEAVDVVKRRWDNGEPIHTTDMTIPANQIKAFRKTSKQFGGQPLLEAAAQAFDEPMYTDDGDIKSRWVKKEVSRREYQKHYAAIPSYRKLDDSGNMVVIAFRLPVHEIDENSTTHCTENDLTILRK